jgi:hypothetical protein
MKYIYFFACYLCAICKELIKNCSFSGHLSVLAKLYLLTNKSIYWSKRHLAGESEQAAVWSICEYVQGVRRCESKWR